MTVKVAINGFGRIGRLVFKRMLNDPDFDVVALNDLTDAKTLAHLLKYDSVHGRFPAEVKVDGDKILVGSESVVVYAERDPAALPWKELGVEYVIESTGVFRTRDKIAKHLEAGAKKVALTVPAKDEIDATIVLGVNDEDLKPEHQIVSNASCTTNCLAPMTKVLHDAFGIKRGMMVTVHGYTNDQRLLDLPHKDLRRSRAAAMNTIPTTTGAAKAVGKVIPICIACTGSGWFHYRLDRRIGKTCHRGGSHSSIFDSLSTMVMEGNLVKVLSWYDNEWGYSCRVVDLLKKMASM